MCLCIYHTEKVLLQLQCPEEKLIPSFRETFQRFFIQVPELSMDFSFLVAEFRFSRTSPSILGSQLASLNEGVSQYQLMSCIDL